MEVSAQVSPLLGTAGWVPQLLLMMAFVTWQSFLPPFPCNFPEPSTCNLIVALSIIVPAQT